MIQKAGPILGKVDIVPDCVEKAREAWIQLIANEYFKLLQEGEKWRRFDTDLNRFEQPGLTLFQILIPDDTLFGQPDRSKIQCHPVFFYKLADVDHTTPQGYLIKAIHKKIIESGFLCTTVEVRLEQGCFHNHAPRWHVDVFQTALSINFSNVINWSTKILNQKDYIEIFGSTFCYHNDSDAKIEERAHPGDFGLVYDVTKLLHRSPFEEDIPSRVALSADHYRLFFRFR